MGSKIERIDEDLCNCGCGQPVSLATKTNSARGDIKGQPVRFIVGHASRKQTTTVRFEVEKQTGCWLWQGSKISTGYGNLRVNGKYVLAHRYMYELVKGKIPNGLELDHLCRNHLCINPTHLETVTHAENCRRGVRAKLSHKIVEEIKELKRNHQSTAFIADYYNVDVHTINSVLNGKAWS